MLRFYETKNAGRFGYSNIQIKASVNKRFCLMVL